MNELIRRLQNLEWNKPGAMRRVEDALTDFWNNNPMEHIARYLERMIYPDPIVNRTNELHSWKLFRTQVWDLALNQFVPNVGRCESENIHNHTRPLVSLTLSGGYKQSYYDVSKHDFTSGEVWTGYVTEREQPWTYPGHVYLIDTDIYHALTAFMPDTLTLAVYGPLHRHEIICFNRTTNTVEFRRTAQCAKERLIQTLRGNYDQR